MEPEFSLPQSQVPITYHYPEPFQVRGLLFDCIATWYVFTVRSELLAPRPTAKLEHHPLSAVRDCLFNIFAATLHIGDCSSIRNLRTRHAVVTGTVLPR